MRHFGFPKAREEPHDERLAGAQAGVGSVDRGGVDPDEHLVVRGLRPFDIFEAKDLGRTVSVPDDSSHASRVQLP